MSDKEFRPSLAQLRTFVTIAEHRHFGTAASKLEISQPSLSQALVALEQGLNMQLIERSTRKVIVTKAGECLLPYAKATLDATEEFMACARGSHGTLSGPLTIGIIPTIAPYLLPELLRRLHDTYPELAPRIVEEQTEALLTRLRDGQIDVALIALPSETTGIVDIPLYTERFRVAMHAGHPLAGRVDLQVADLADLNLLLLDDGHCLRDQILDLCRSAHINPSLATNSVTRAASLTTLMQLVIAGLGATLVPESALATECTRPGVALAEFGSEVTAERKVGLVYRSSAARQAEFEAFGTLVSDAFHAVLAENQHAAL